MLGPTVRHGKDTTHKTCCLQGDHVRLRLINQFLEEKKYTRTAKAGGLMCNARAWPVIKRIHSNTS